MLWLLDDLQSSLSANTYYYSEWLNVFHHSNNTTTTAFSWAVHAATSAVTIVSVLYNVAATQPTEKNRFKVKKTDARSKQTWAMWFTEMRNWYKIWKEVERIKRNRLYHELVATDSHSRWSQLFPVLRFGTVYQLNCDWTHFYSITFR